MATTENNGLMIYQDESGNKFILYPITKADLVDGLEELLDGKAAAAHASQHASGGSDPITPASIGAAALGADGKVLTTQLPEGYTKDQTLAASTKSLFGLDGSAVPDDVFVEIKNRMVNKSGDTMTGRLTVATPSYTTILIAETTNNTGTFIENGGHSTSIAHRNVMGDNANQRILTLRDSVSSSSLKNALRLTDKVSGVSTDYSLLHEGNISNFGLSRVATGSYDGTGNYGGSVTLTCGFKPAFAIIYRADRDISATTVPVDTNISGATDVAGDWSGNFAILVPMEGTNGIGIYSNEIVKVKSGDTYLKFTPSGYELNHVGATYQYIIVGV